MLNSFEQMEAKKKVIFGTGSGARTWLESVDPSFDYFVDNDPKKWGDLFQGKVILHPETLLREDKEAVVVWVASEYYAEISRQLTEMGFEEGIHYFNALDELILSQWHRDGAVMPPPHVLKRKVVRTYANQFQLQLFIETGTYKGDMLSDMKRTFRKLYSIELERTLYQNARLLFAEEDHITIVNGDSATSLGELLQEVDEPALFWLDGHYSGEKTAKGARNTPVIDELKHIFSHPINEHVILIDDARLFNGQDDYPTMDELLYFVNMHKPGYRCDVELDIIRLYRPRG